MVSKSKELGFGVLTARVPNEIMVVLEELLIANGAEIFKIGLPWKKKKLKLHLEWASLPPIFLLVLLASTLAKYKTICNATRTPRCACGLFFKSFESLVVMKNN
jgi:hypothetical protein